MTWGIRLVQWWLTEKVRTISVLALGNLPHLGVSFMYPGRIPDREKIILVPFISTAA